MMIEMRKLMKYAEKLFKIDDSLENFETKRPYKRNLDGPVLLSMLT